MTAEIITIGDEILIGQTVDTNSTFIAKEFNKIGLSINRISSIKDSESDILTTLNSCLNYSDIVIVTGGLGPTNDDITKNTLLKFFNDKLITDHNVLDNIKFLWKKYIKQPLLQVNIDQSLVPSKAHVFLNTKGSAPGLWLQKNNTIFILAASFHKKEDGYEHQQAIKTTIKQPEQLLSWSELLTQYDKFLPPKMKDFLSIERPIDFKPVHIANPLENKNLPAVEDIWFKLKGDTTNLELTLKHQILTYISDYNILNAALKPNASKATLGNTQMASLDHSMWFFRDFDFDDWMLFSAVSPSSSGARGLATGNIFKRDGTLIATVAQEGLLRPINK